MVPILKAVGNTSLSHTGTTDVNVNSSQNTAVGNSHASPRTPENEIAADMMNRSTRNNT